MIVVTLSAILSVSLQILGSTTTTTTAFVSSPPLSTASFTTRSAAKNMTTLNAKSKLSSLPSGISPFEKSLARYRDYQGEFRKTSLTGLRKALKNGIKTMEIEFPPLLEEKDLKHNFPTPFNLAGHLHFPYIFDLRPEHGKKELTVEKRERMPTALRFLLPLRSGTSRSYPS